MIVSFAQDPATVSTDTVSVEVSIGFGHRSTRSSDTRNQMAQVIDANAGISKSESTEQAELDNAGSNIDDWVFVDSAASG